MEGLNILALIGICFYSILACLPAPTFINAVKKKEIVHDYQLFPIITNVIQAAILICYGLKIDNKFIYCCFIFGYCVYLCYTVAILYIENENDLMLKYGGALIGGTLIIWLILPAQLVGILLIAYYIGFCYLQIGKIKDDLKNKKSETLTMLLVICNFFGYAAWFCYSVSLKDVFLITSFLIGFIYWIINIIIFYWIQGSISDENIVIVQLKKLLIAEDVNQLENEQEHPNAKLNLLTENDFK